MKINQIAPKLQSLVSQKELARVLEVTPRTIRNWGRKSDPGSFPKLGRPAHRERAHQKTFWLVGREYLRQGRCGWRGIHHALEGRVPVRLVQQYTRVFKSCEKRHERRRILPRRKRIEVVASNALWVQDATRVGREESGIPIESEVIKDRGSLTLLGITTGSAARSVDVIDTLERLKEKRGLPLVWGSDNGSSYISLETENYLRREKVIHLKSLPRTPQHNGSAEVGIGELKRCAGVGRAWRGTSEAAHAKLARAATLLNKNRLRASKGFKTGRELDETMIVSYDQVERAWFYEECSKRIEESQLGKTGTREKRMAEREAIFETMEQYGLIRRHGGGSHAAAKEEIFS